MIKKIEPIGDSLNGIINHLYYSLTENYHFFVSVISSSTLSQCDEQALIIPTRDSTADIDNWASQNIAKSNFTVYFHKHVIDITHYSFRTQNVNYCDHPKTWILEGSLDGKAWHLIDEQEGLTELSAPGVLKTFAVKKKGRYSCFKFTQTGLNSYNQHLFDLGKVEFFGVLYSTNMLQRIRSLNCQRRMNSSFLLFIILLLKY